MGLIIALDENSKASGILYWDDGESKGKALALFADKVLKMSRFPLNMPVLLKTRS